MDIIKSAYINASVNSRWLGKTKSLEGNKDVHFITLIEVLAEK